jgi:hypothetical protein
MKIDIKIIDFLVNKKDLTKAELLFVLLLYSNKTICLSELKKYTHFINNQSFRDKLNSMKDIIPFKLESKYGVNVYELIFTKNQYISIDTFENLYKKSVKEILLYLTLVKFGYTKKIFLTREFIENTFNSLSNFAKLIKLFPDFNFIVKKKFKFVIGYDVVKNNNALEVITDNLQVENKKEILEIISDKKDIVQEDIKVLDKQIKSKKTVNKLHEQIKEIEIKRTLELEKIKQEQEIKDKVISDIQSNYNELKDVIEELFVSDKTTLEYIMYNKCINENKDIFKNQVVINHLYNNKDKLKV